LRDYYDATADPRVLPFLRNYYHYMLRSLPGRPLRDWAKSRAGDDMDTAIWLYDRTGEPFLLELVDLLRRQAYDWPTIMHQNSFESFDKDFQPKHNVNIPQAMKMPAVSWQRTGDERERTAIDAGEANLMRDHGLSIGMQSGTEFLAGRSPGQGVEFCAIVEQMLSDETIVRIFGDGTYADHLEQIAYNALPAAWNRDLTALRYYTLPNHVIAKRGPQGFGQNYDNGVVYGPRSGYPCCCFNVHQGWPKFVQNSWAATSDNGLAAIAYAPTTVTASVGDGSGATATIVEETNYPFDDEIRFKITMSAPATFPIALRTPGWCDRASITVNGRSVEAAKPGDFQKITRQWNSGDEIVVKLPMTVRTVSGVHGSVSVHRGPLVYSLQIEHDKHIVDQPAPGFNEFEETPTGQWNYALDPGRDIELLRDEKPLARANPFTPEATPIKLTASARQLPAWGLAWNGVVALDPPISPVQSNERETRVTLVPFGAEDLRLTDFPILGEPAGAPPNPLTFPFDQNDTTGWTTIGGGWWVHDGRLRTTPNGGAPGYKALLENLTCADVRIEADVTPPPTGDAGVIFRVSKPSIGADAYQGYYAGISASGNQVILGRADGLTWTPLKIVPHVMSAERSTKLSVTAVGNGIEVRVNDETSPAIAIADDRWTTGQIGVRMFTSDNDHAISAFGNVRVIPGSQR
ncbi:MAG TPA: beta-L-arabinofuranosidase domain-containing protein, partial [Tepidisphaeraceae bacterium]|nr:beta-L-arabinofuranosidase domain-containing protein [Tepidisphaeraceae bacterium]